MKKSLKIAVSGAAGQISYSLLFRLASGEVFGKDTKIDLQLLEVTPALNALKGVVMELEDCAYPALNNILITDDPRQAMKEANWVVLVGAMPRKEGMERSDLLQKNGSIFIEQGRAINEQAADDVRVFVVGNPCNTNCLIAMHNATDVPRDRFYAMTMLDQNRAKTQLAQKVGKSVEDVTNMIIWGNHSSTQYPDFYNAKISGQAVTDVIQDKAWLEEAFIETVQKRGAAVIKARGASSAASAANAALESIKVLAHDTSVEDSYSMCRCSEGEYGIDEGLIFSFPCRTEKGKLKVLTSFKHNDFGQAKIEATLKELREEYQAVLDLKLIQ